MAVKKAVIPIAGLGTRFLPLTKAVPKEFLPLVDKPVLQYIIEEALASGIKEIIFVNRPEKKGILKYFEPNKNLIKTLKKRKKESILKELKRLDNISKNISFKQVFQRKPLGDGHALLQAKSLIGKTACAVAWADDIVESKTPCFLQLIRVFQKYRRPVIALSRIPKESFSSYGLVAGKKIGPRTYRLTKIIEKPQVKEAPSNLAIVGRYVLNPEIFDFLSKARSNKKGEISMSDILAEKIREGKEILGYEFEGKWLECGNKLAYLKSNLYLSLKHPQFGKELKKFLKK